MTVRMKLANQAEIRFFARVAQQLVAARILSEAAAIDWVTSRARWATEVS